jgi:hypothetical protein
MRYGTPFWAGGIANPLEVIEQITTIAPTGPEHLFDDEKVTRLFTRIREINGEGLAQRQRG